VAILERPTTVYASHKIHMIAMRSYCATGSRPQHTEGGMGSVEVRASQGRKKVGALVRAGKKLGGKLGVALVIVFGAHAQVAGKDLGVFGNPALWQWPPTRTYHVENYRLTLHFDDSKGEVFGDEVVTLRPFQGHFRTFYLDSSELTIESVSLQSPTAAPITLKYAAQGPRLWITLDRDYGAGSELNVRIAYHGFPRAGLFFVNPTPAYPRSPREVYSQGEAEFNHYWFPCWDYPNDLATSETVTTVPDGQTVVSNGKLVGVTRSAGQVTYDWLERVPHSSYLISLAIGPWRKVSDRYEDKPVDYYVPNYVDDATARRSLHLTPDMIGFFSRATGIDYPYEQYAQTTVHNFIFGGQENVSATTLTEYTLHDERADHDYPSTGLVSHELAQHWTGDLVQGRDWANIWLNEGFATYLQALYTQYHEGNDAFRFEIYNDQLTEQAQQRADYLRPIVDRHYSDPMQMFDAITHEKGAAVLDMLRNLLDGREAAAHAASQEEPLFLALRHYLSAHRAQSADTADLIEALRETTGQELGWFFRQWVFMAGHPDYRVTAHYDAVHKLERLSVAQMQRADVVTPVFDMPIDVAFHGGNGERQETQLRDHLRTQEFDVPLAFAPQWVAFDPDDVIDKTVQFAETTDALVAQAAKDPSMMSRLWAVGELGRQKGTNVERSVAALTHVLSEDAFYGVRAAAAAALGRLGTGKAKAALLAALQQSDSRVRTAIVQGLRDFPKDRLVNAALVDTLHNDTSYAAEAAAAEALGRTGDAGAFEVLQAEAALQPEVHVMRATLDGLVASRDARAVAILLAQAQPGVPERIRVTALAGLAKLKHAVGPERARELVGVVQAGLQDPFLPVREAAVELAGSFHLTQFRADIQKDADAPLDTQRDLAQKVLAQFKSRPMNRVNAR
jgi:aminopeptidase N